MGAQSRCVVGVFHTGGWWTPPSGLRKHSFALLPSPSPGLSTRTSSLPRAFNPDFGSATVERYDRRHPRDSRRAPDQQRKRGARCAAALIPNDKAQWQLSMAFDLTAEIGEGEVAPFRETSGRSSSPRVYVYILESLRTGPSRAVCVQ